jgi:hypothetical protein
MKLKDRIAWELLHRIGERGDILIPNFFVGRWEADLYMVRKSGIVVEYEIKTTRSDFFNDFKKNTGTYTSTPKHLHIKTGDRMINRFYFVVPRGLVSEPETPSYCGLIFYDDNGTFSEIRQAPLLRKKFTINFEEIARKLSFREYIIRDKFKYHKETIDDLRHDIAYLRSRLKKQTE